MIQKAKLLRNLLTLTATLDSLARATRGGGRSLLPLVALAGLLLAASPVQALEGVPFKGIGHVAPIFGDDVPAELIVPQTEYPDPAKTANFVIPYYYEGDGWNTQLGHFRYFMRVFLHVSVVSFDPFTIDWTKGAWVSDGAGYFIAANGDRLDYQWSDEVLNPATPELTSGRAFLRGGTGRFADAEGETSWDVWETDALGSRTFVQDGWIRSVGSRRRH